MDVKESIHRLWPDWTVLEPIGRGAYGVVYRARRQDIAGTSYAAIKVTSIPTDPSELDALRAEGMTPEQSRSYLESAVRDLATEIRMMEKVRGYTNIVTIEDYKIDEHPEALHWDIFIRMELLTPLNRWLMGRDLGEADIIRLGKDMCNALAVCRKANIVHRDIKPENIFINDEGVFKLGDFGVSRNLERHTFNMSQKGTYNYMAPEVFNGTLREAGIDDAVKVDICSLGLVLYRLANGGRLPFIPDRPDRTPQDYRDALTRRMSGEKLPLPSDVSKELGEIILNACAYSPKQRYPSAVAMRKALEALEGRRAAQEEARDSAPAAPAGIPGFSGDARPAVEPHGQDGREHKPSRQQSAPAGIPDFLEDARPAVEPHDQERHEHKPSRQQGASAGIPDFLEDDYPAVGPRDQERREHKPSRQQSAPAGIPDFLEDDHPAVEPREQEKRGFGPSRREAEVSSSDQPSRNPETSVSYHPSRDLDGRFSNPPSGSSDGRYPYPPSGYDDGRYAVFPSSQRDQRGPVPSGVPGQRDEGPADYSGEVSGSRAVPHPDASGDRSGGTIATRPDSFSDPSSGSAAARSDPSGNSGRPIPIRPDDAFSGDAQGTVLSPVRPQNQPGTPANRPDGTVRMGTNATVAEHPRGSAGTPPSGSDGTVRMGTNAIHMQGAHGTPLPPPEPDDTGKKRRFAVLIVILGIIIALLLAVLFVPWDELFKPKPAPTDTASPGPTDTASPGPTDTASPGPTDTASPGPTDTASPGPTDTASPGPTDTASPGPTDTASPGPTDTASPGPTDTATPGPTDTASPGPTDTASPGPTDTASPGPTDTATPGPTDTPAPTDTATPAPTARSLSLYTIPYDTSASSIYTNKKTNTQTLYASHAIDGDLLTGWNADDRKEAEWQYGNEWLKVSFSDGKSYQVSGFRIAPGYWKKKSLYRENFRPRQIEVTADGAFVGSFTVQDQEDYQTFRFPQPVEARSIQFTITSVYTERVKYPNVVITEIELIGPGSSAFSSATWGECGRSVRALHDEALSGSITRSSKARFSVMGLQVLLRDEFHVYSGAADGVFDAETAKAVNALAADMESTLGSGALPMKKNTVDANYWNNMIAYGALLHP